MMLKEDALAVFKVSVKYESQCHDEVVEIIAKNTPEAMAECRRMFEESERIRAFRESRNVYCSKRVVSFDLLERPWREVLMCLPNLEDNV
jgi:hypothetical protein